MWCLIKTKQSDAALDIVSWKVVSIKRCRLQTPPYHHHLQLQLAFVMDTGQGTADSMSTLYPDVLLLISFTRPSCHPTLLTGDPSPDTTDLMHAYIYVKLGIQSLNNIKP